VATRELRVENRARALAMERRWVQAAFTLRGPPLCAQAGAEPCASGERCAGQSPEGAVPGQRGVGGREHPVPCGCTGSGDPGAGRPAAGDAAAGAAGQAGACCDAAAQSQAPGHATLGGRAPERPPLDARPHPAAQRGCAGAPALQTASAAAPASHCSDAGGPAAAACGVRDSGAAEGPARGAALGAAGAAPDAAEWEAGAADGRGGGGDGDAGGLSLGALFDAGAPEEVEELVRGPRLTIWSPSPTSGPARVDL